MVAIPSPAKFSRGGRLCHTHGRGKGAAVAAVESPDPLKVNGNIHAPFVPILAPEGRKGY
jgi:hypothetical protein